MRYVSIPTKSLTMHPDTDGDFFGSGPSWNPVNVDGPNSVDTGLLDAKGNAIWRLQVPVGFGRDSEW